MQKMTYSRQDCFKTCRRKHHFAYDLGIRPREDARALRMGSIHHAALKAAANQHTFDEAIAVIRERYEELPEGYDPKDWMYECETVERIFCGYVWRWQAQPLNYVAKEMAFQLPLKNPATGAASREWTWDGVIDGIIQLDDGRLAVVEHKLLSEDLDPSSAMWRRMRVDHQISLYVLAARQLGYEVESVLYDVSRKPTIKPTGIPSTDEHGMKVVVDEGGNRIKNKSGEWRQTGSTENGWAVVSRPMTPGEWGIKLTSDIAERPDFYFARVEIPRLDQDLQDCLAELWDIQKTMRDAQVNNRHYRTCNKNTCSFCPYFDLCTTGYDHRYPLPESFVKVDDIHPELRLENRNDDTKRTACAACAATEESTAAASTA